MAPIRDRIFISYSHADRDCLELLLPFLQPLQRALNIVLWHDTVIEPGDRWREQIEQGLAQARVAILLVSASFFASDFIANVELPALLQAADKHDVTIVPVVLSASRLDREPALFQFQAVNSPDQPLDSLPDHAVHRILQEVANRCADLLQVPDTSPVFSDPERWYRNTPRDEFLAQVEHICRLRERDLVEVRTQRSAVPPMLKSQEADIVYVLLGSLAEEVRRDARLKLAPVVPPTNQWLTFIDQYDPKSPWSDQRVRLAANHAVNLPALNEAETLGYSVITGSIVPSKFDYALPCEP